MPSTSAQAPTTKAIATTHLVQLTLPRWRAESWVSAGVITGRVGMACFPCVSSAMPAQTTPKGCRWARRDADRYFGLPGGAVGGFPGLDGRVSRGSSVVAVGDGRVAVEGSGALVSAGGGTALVDAEVGEGVVGAVDGDGSLDSVGFCTVLPD